MRVLIYRKLLRSVMINSTIKKRVLNDEIALYTDSREKVQTMPL